jgi:type II secretory pathway pseudopilin PulG
MQCPSGRPRCGRITPPRPAASRTAGHSLVELLLALAIIVAAVAGAVTLYARGRDLQRASDAHQRLQEVARLALAVIETDLRMAGFRGLLPEDAPVTLDAALSFPAKCGGLNWLAPAAGEVDGSNNRYLTAANCAAIAGGAQPGADVLVVRRASADRIVLTSASVPSAERDRVLLVSSRSDGALFLPQTLGGGVPTGFPAVTLTGPAPDTEVRAWRVNAYYVSSGSSAGADVPALRRKSLTGGPGIGDEEIAVGIEDLQFRLGVDTDADSNVDSYFEPATLPAGAVPLCARVWLRLRSVERDNPPGGSAASSYADRHWPAVDDGYSRILASKTVLLRNIAR